MYSPAGVSRAHCLARPPATSRSRAREAAPVRTMLGKKRGRRVMRQVTVTRCSVFLGRSCGGEPAAPCQPAACDHLESTDHLLARLWPPPSRRPVEIIHHERTAQIVREEVSTYIFCVNVSLRYFTVFLCRVWWCLASLLVIEVPVLSTRLLGYLFSGDNLAW